MKKSLGSGEIIYEGIPYTQQGTPEYQERAKQNTPKESLGSHIFNITRLNMYDPQKEKTLKRRGSVDFIDSNTFDKGKGLQTIGKQRGEIQKDTYDVYSDIYGKPKGIVPGTPHFNLNPNDPNNKFYSIPGKQTAETLKEKKLFPFD